MKSEKAIAGIRDLQRFYGEQYKGRDINAIYKELLSFPEAALTWAVGEMKIMFSRLPDAEKILEMCRKWEEKLQAETAVDHKDEGKEMLGIMRAWMEERITPAEYHVAMHRLAEKYNQVVYAQMGDEALAKFKMGKKICAEILD